MTRTARLGALRLVAVAATFLAGACLLVLASSAEATSIRASKVDAIGGATLAKPRVAVYARPFANSRRLATLAQFRPDYRPQYVLALSAVRTKDERATWYRISFPGRPNGQSGWVRAPALELRPMRKRLVIFRGARRFEFWDGNRLVRKGRVAVGKRGAETPTGLFFVTWKFDPRVDPDWAILGDYAFETSAYSKLTDWPGGGIVGVHGTPWPWLLGQAVSHGCVRMHNRDILFLKSRVPLGMPIKIVR